MSQHQISVLMEFWLHAASDEDIKRSYWQGKREDGPADDDLRELGYSPEQIKAIKADLNGRK